MEAGFSPKWSLARFPLSLVSLAFVFLFFPFFCSVLNICVSLLPPLFSFEKGNNKKQLKARVAAAVPGSGSAGLRLRNGGSGRREEDFSSTTGQGPFVLRRPPPFEEPKTDKKGQSRRRCGERERGVEKQRENKRESQEDFSYRLSPPDLSRKGKPKDAALRATLCSCRNIHGVLLCFQRNKYKKAEHKETAHGEPFGRVVFFSSSA